MQRDEEKWEVIDRRTYPHGSAVETVTTKSGDVIVVIRRKRNRIANEDKFAKNESLT